VSSRRDLTLPRTEEYRLEPIYSLSSSCYRQAMEGMENMSDEEIRNQVISQLNWDCRLDATGIEVSAENGMVTLTGAVRNDLARHMAEMDCFTVPGVFSVENNLLVDSPEPASASGDREVREAIEMLLSCNPDVDASDIRVFVSDGAVTLEGSVDSFWKKTKAEELASTTAGVVRMTNHLAVVPSRSIADQVIADDLLSALERDQKVEVASILVKVENGVVTLSGKVPDPFVYRIVYEKAKNTAGVLEIENRLSVSARPEAGSE
jgi:osmotically-inducible protein OsmY